MTSAWSHGWECDIVYLLRMRTSASLHLELMRASGAQKR